MEQTDLESTTLNITSYNCNVFSDRKIPFIKQLFEESDFLLIQEHGLYSSMFHRFSQICSNASYCGSSDMIETEVLVGRPRGGTAILWKSDVVYDVKSIKCESSRLSAVLLTVTSIVSVLLFNVYMPCDERHDGENLIEFNNEIFK